MQTTWYKIEVKGVGAIVATGKRTVSAVLWVMGLSGERHYPKYPQGLLLDYLRTVERPLNPQPVNVARVLRGAVATAQERAAETGFLIIFA